jgi:polar amino acid transport system ATP-binding protein/sulfate transport system ATP-binding protein
MIDYVVLQSLIKVTNATALIDGRPIIRDLNMEIRNIHREGMAQGQVVALLGPSGMGKTTLFRLLAGLAQPSSGEVLVGSELKPVEAGMVGVVFQQYRLFEHRTVLGNLVVAANRMGLRGETAEKRSMDLLDRFGLEGLDRRYPAQLSGGQRQRVAIAQQFICSHYFLLMDEPFSGLDPLAVDRVCRLVNEVATADELNTIIVVTHNIEAGLKVADTVMLLGRDRDEKGQVVPGARIQAVYDLAKMGLAWRENVDTLPEFAELEREIRAKFRDM